MTETALDNVAAQLGRDHSARFLRRMPNHGSPEPEIVGEPPISNGFARLVFLFSGFAVAAAVLILAAAHYLGNEIAKGGYSDSKTLHQIVVGNDMVTVAGNTIRFASQRKSANQNRLDLYFHWPTMNGYSDELKPYFVNQALQNKIIFVTLEPRQMPAEMSGRIDSIYAKFFDGPPSPTAFGLIKQPLSAESGYVDEDLVIQKNSPYPFTARCLRDNAGGSKPYCIRDIHVGEDLMATVRFHSALLPEWMKMDQLVRNQLKWMLSR